MLLLLNVNPLPWTSGSLGIKYNGKRPIPIIFKDEGLRVYQQAVRAGVEAALAELSFMPVEPPYKLTFYLWRALEQGDVGTDRKRRAHQADATNMQKALEDALQDLLIGNDRDVDDIRTVIVDQGPEVEPGVVIEITDSLSMVPSRILDARAEQLQAARDAQQMSSNDHIAEEMF